VYIIIIMKRISLDNLIYQKLKEIIHFEIETEIWPKLDSIEGKIKFLPTKEDYYTKMDSLIGEIKDMRQEHEMAMYQLHRANETNN